jgi:hypothetical protein
VHYPSARGACARSRPRAGHPSVANVQQWIMGRATIAPSPSRSPHSVSVGGRSACRTELSEEKTSCPEYRWLFFRLTQPPKARAFSEFLEAVPPATTQPRAARIAGLSNRPATSGAIARLSHLRGDRLRRKKSWSIQSSEEVQWGFSWIIRSTAAAGWCWRCCEESFGLPPAPNASPSLASVKRAGQRDILLDSSSPAEFAEDTIP